MLTFSISLLFVACRDQSLRACAWFLEIAFVRKVGMCVRVCVCVRACVCPPQGYKLHLRDIEPVQPAEQVCCI